MKKRAEPFLDEIVEDAPPPPKVRYLRTSFSKLATIAYYQGDTLSARHLPHNKRRQPIRRPKQGRSMIEPR